MFKQRVHASIDIISKLLSVVSKHKEYCLELRRHSQQTLPVCNIREVTYRRTIRPKPRDSIEHISGDCLLIVCLTSVTLWPGNFAKKSTDSLELLLSIAPQQHSALHASGEKFPDVSGRLSTSFIWWGRVRYTILRKTVLWPREWFRIR